MPRTESYHIYADLNEKSLVNMAIGIWQGTGKNRKLLATVPLATWSSSVAREGMRRGWRHGNCSAVTNAEHVARAKLIASTLDQVYNP